MFYSIQVGPPGQDTPTVLEEWTTIWVLTTNIKKLEFSFTLAVTDLFNFGFYCLSNKLVIHLDQSIRFHGIHKKSEILAVDVENQHNISLDFICNKP